MAQSIEEWFAGGERLELRLPNRAPARTPSPNKTGESAKYFIFSRVEGSGPWLTFLHGFPTCSWDWVHIVPALKSSYRLLFFDFLGFGDSDKPADHAYSLFEQADLLNALWLHFGITETGLVAHDYGSTVAIEQLSRLGDSDLSPRIPGAVLLNAGVYVDLQHPVLAQRLLQKPVAGPVLSQFIGESFFNRQFASIFSSAHPVSAADLKQHWSGIVRRHGNRNYHKLIYYLTERRQNKRRWERTLEAPPVPLRFIWGLADPVSGKQISDHIRARVAGANLLELPEVGHYPQLEAPDTVAREIGAFFSSLLRSQAFILDPSP